MKDKTTKKGVVPRPADSGYCAGTTEDPRWNEGKKGWEKNECVEIADAPAVHDREHAQPSMGPARKKDDSHAHNYPGRSYEIQEVKDAVAKPVSRDVVNSQLGSNRRLGS